MKIKILFWVILISSVSLRLFYAWTAPYSVTPIMRDTATIWLMARHILHGNLPLFFYGQYYLGPLEPLVIALFFKIFSIKIFTLYLGTIFFSALYIISSYFLGKILKDRLTGLFTMLLAAVPPVYFFWESIVPLGYHIEIPLLGNSIFILVLIIPHLRFGLRKFLAYILLGALSGIGFWTHYIIVYYLIPSAVYLFFQERPRNYVCFLAVGLIGFFTVSFPFWKFVLVNDFISFRLNQSVSSFYGANLIWNAKEFINILSDMFRLNVSADLAGRCAQLFLYFLYISGVMFFLIRTIRTKKFVYCKESIFVYFFIFIMLIYVIYRSYANVNLRDRAYLIPVFSFISISTGYLLRSASIRWRYAGALILVPVLTGNVFSISKMIQDNIVCSEKKGREIKEEIGYFEKNNIFRYYGSERDTRDKVFFSDEKIIATGYFDSEYYPYQDIVSASDEPAFECQTKDLCDTLDNICAKYKCERGILYDFVPHHYVARSIIPLLWRAVLARDSSDLKYAYDRNYDYYWKVKKGGIFTVDMGKEYLICKIEIFNGHRACNYPKSCKIEVSLDGINWKETAFIESIQPFFWSGPRIYWDLRDGRIEWYFAPVSARFIRLIQSGENIYDLWGINEFFVYEYLGQKIEQAADYISEAEQIISFLYANNVNFVYADFWLSAKIKEISNDRIKTLVPFNSRKPQRKNMSREVVLSRDRAFLVRNENAHETEMILNEFELPYEKVVFDSAICYYFPDLGKKYSSIRSLRWIGTGILKYNLKDYSRWLYNNKQYEKALKYYKNNFLAYQKCEDKLPETLFYPLCCRIIEFSNGIRFLGYSIRGGRLKSGGIVRIEYFWEVEKEPRESLSVFIYFTKDGKIYFQNDHEFLFQFGRPLFPLKNERFREDLRLKIPNDVPKGLYDIIIGLWDRESGKRIPTKGGVSKLKVGEVNLLE